jgi:hypothetical protein
MKQKVIITESMLKTIIAKAINESLGNQGINPTKAIYHWAMATKNNCIDDCNSNNWENWKLISDPRQLKEFEPFYRTIMNDYRATQAVIYGIAAETKEVTSYDYEVHNPEMYPYLIDNGEVGQSEIEYLNQRKAGEIETELNQPSMDDMEKPNRPNGKVPLRILDLIHGSHVNEDIISDFLLGANCSVRENSKPDSFTGMNLINSVGTILTEGVNKFWVYLSQMLTFYAGHYTRNHYKEWVMQYGVNSKSIGGDKTNAIQDDNDGDDVSADYEFKQTNDDNRFFTKMVNFAEKILSDNTVGLGPQEKKMLQCLIDISREPMNPERLERMQDLSPTQQNQEIYQEISDRTGLEIDKIKRSLSAAIQKAKQSKYAKMLEEKRKRANKKILNEMIKKILNELLS